SPPAQLGPGGILQAARLLLSRRSRLDFPAANCTVRASEYYKRRSRREILLTPSDKCRWAAVIGGGNVLRLRAVAGAGKLGRRLAEVCCRRRDDWSVETGRPGDSGDGAAR